MMSHLLLSWNVNGLRSVYQKGALNRVFREKKPDIFCLQEVKASPDQLPTNLTKLNGYYFYCHPAQKKGYAGVAIYTRVKPKGTVEKLGLSRFDNEGRFLGVDFGSFFLANFYFPHGGRQKENLDYKLEVYDYFLHWISQHKGKNLVIGGDFNIAHEPIDLARPKENENNTMFTPQEREKIDELVGLGFVDSFRIFNKEGGHYTWWPYWGKARERNLGWRLDYIFFSLKLKRSLKQAFIFPEIFGSDHCPVGATFTI